MNSLQVCSDLDRCSLILDWEHFVFKAPRSEAQTLERLPSTCGFPASFLVTKEVPDTDVT